MHWPQEPPSAMVEMVSAVMAGKVPMVTVKVKQTEMANSQIWRSLERKELKVNDTLLIRCFHEQVAAVTPGDSCIKVCVQHVLNVRVSTRKQFVFIKVAKVQLHALSDDQSYCIVHLFACAHAEMPLKYQIWRFIKNMKFIPTVVYLFTHYA